MLDLLGEAPPRGPVLGRRHQLSEIAVLGRVHEDGAIEDVGGRQFSTEEVVILSDGFVAKICGGESEDEA